MEDKILVDKEDLAILWLEYRDYFEDDGQIYCPDCKASEKLELVDWPNIQQLNHKTDCIRSALIKRVEKMLDGFCF